MTSFFFNIAEKNTFFNLPRESIELYEKKSSKNTRYQAQ